MSEDEWGTGGRRFTEPSTLAELRRMLEDESPLIVEHRFYRGASAPHRFVCDDADALEKYLQTKTRPGDAICVWSFEACCQDANMLHHGEIPDAYGRTPKRGAY